ncbi:hypothetical protein SAMN05892883_4174 [Jatrophihabitans sp. GAS493]|uniref:WXG100 family type VII secretion target n=1 Tax=Jatrophihabitans sp. GAS493 TaxID=1907575 RepID=UPI000BB9578A|nr:hypothetical protein [Jatrophihabitans sp. GAS493]SOD74977.1 hypothetical protein SAMN05892883_4174 [Jatrophihabitans sp. GAS493]
MSDEFQVDLAALDGDVQVLTGINQNTLEPIVNDMVGLLKGIADAAIGPAADQWHQRQSVWAQKYTDNQNALNDVQARLAEVHQIYHAGNQQTVRIMG